MIRVFRPAVESSTNDFFMLDNAPLQAANIVKEYIEENFSNSLNHLEYNIIEYCVWI